MLRIAVVNKASGRVSYIGYYAEATGLPVFSEDQDGQIIETAISDQELMANYCFVQGTWIRCGEAPSPWHILQNGEWVLSRDLATTAVIEFVNSTCESVLTSGFVSDVLGSSHRYDSEQTDQLNLIGFASMQTGGYYKCEDVATGSKTFRHHTAAQAGALLLDAGNVKMRVLQEATRLKEAAASASTVEAFTAILESALGNLQMASLGVNPSESQI